MLGKGLSTFFTNTFDLLDPVTVLKLGGGNPLQLQILCITCALTLAFGGVGQYTVKGKADSSGSFSTLN